ncbi:hypothetical protein [Sphingomonas sp. Leaf4]|uniref:hypothetical protein n=1 Tax=Sphingomonas sp. Leaf4 TaxID=2876553 RepID=UPI001E29F91B|nr:hypothetical protein [Sphingomonas sp. Leaf4]
MILDTVQRHRQSLDPAALTSITTTLRALIRAVEDCDRVGVMPEHDPATMLLARHLGRIGARDLAEPIPRQDCRRQIATSVDERLLLAIAEAGLTDDGIIQRFHEQARLVLYRLASALGGAIGAFEVRTHLDVGLTGRSVLHGDSICVTLGFGYTRDRCTIGYRQVRGQRDDCGGRPYHTGLSDLLDIPALANRIINDLCLPAVSVSTRVIAQAA